MKCKYCGKKISPELAYCPYCRRPQTQLQASKTKALSQDTDLFVNMNRQRRKKAVVRNKPLTIRQQMFPYLLTFAAVVVLCVVLVWTSQAWGHFRMERQALANYGVTPQSMENIWEEAQETENQKEQEALSQEEEADSAKEES